VVVTLAVVGPVFAFTAFALLLSAGALESFVVTLLAWTAISFGLIRQLRRASTRRSALLGSIVSGVWAAGWVLVVVMALVAAYA
jgi:hypothetical protein